MKSAGTGALDQRTKVWRQLSRWRAGVIEDRGGIENLSTLELDAIDQLGKLKLIADSAVEVVLTLPTIYNKRNRSLLPVAIQTMNAINSYLKAATAVGLERRSKPVPSLDEYLASSYTPTVVREESEAPEGSTAGEEDTPGVEDTQVKE
jgi:hypothetical protein